MFRITEWPTWGGRHEGSCKCVLLINIAVYICGTCNLDHNYMIAEGMYSAVYFYLECFHVRASRKSFGCPGGRAGLMQLSDRREA
jgi:hypothetical protein